ncbi:MAG TPA: LLM class F420-dependent oxidoreductase [Thermomicrobiales bacterium]|jgi:F420-dependent oxidoreductase-like protein|nr:LLM class F420-dependent oxidoreductase [Thermomicrobiales bacterium]
MKLAYHYSHFTRPGGPEAIGPTLAATARAADEAGFAQMTLMDHFFQIEHMGPPEDPMLEGYTALGFIAGQTRTLRLGLLVTGVTYRHPGILAKIVTTLDVLSGGRAELGIGAAWFEQEHRALGVPYPPLAERFQRLEETLRICLQMWDEDNNGPFEGKHYQLAETINHPQSIQRPHPTILIGGGGEQKTLRLVARYADACNLFDLGVEGVQAKLDVLKRHCETEGTDYDRIAKTVIIGSDDPATDPDGFLRKAEAYAKIGISQVWTGHAGPDPAAFVAQVGETVVPRLAQL